MNVQAQLTVKPRLDIWLAFSHHYRVLFVCQAEDQAATARSAFEHRDGDGERRQRSHTRLGNFCHMPSYRRYRREKGQMTPLFVAEFPTTS